MTLGFTGTRQIDLVSKERRQELVKVVSSMIDDITLVVHGGALGMDEYFNMIAWHNQHPIKIRHGLHKISYPIRNLKGDGVRRVNVIEVEPKPYLQRNKDIVHECDILIAVPVDPLVEEKRSGTWTTIRYARKLNKQIIII